MDIILNSSAYLIVSLSTEELENLRDQIKAFGATFEEDHLRGTILLSPEGFNVRLSGKRIVILKMQDYLRALDVRFSNFIFKNSKSKELTLPNFLVKLKREIISFDEGINPAVTPRAKHISSTMLKTWMDEKKENVILLDTRNDYEVRLGTFTNARTMPLKSFRQFTTVALTELLPELQQQKQSQKIVMFCTGGVRCEKAALWMTEKSPEHEIYQLEGGILQYFEDVGQAHYEGHCYVFDQRVALQPDLTPVQNMSMCFECRSPLTDAEKKEEGYLENVSCKYCQHGKNDFRSNNNLT